MGIGLILFWPALFFLEGGDGVNASQYSHLKGEFEALEQVAIQKDCGIKINSDKFLVLQGKGTPLRRGFIFFQQQLKRLFPTDPHKANGA